MSDCRYRLEDWGDTPKASLQMEPRYLSDWRQLIADFPSPPPEASEECAELIGLRQTLRNARASEIRAEAGTWREAIAGVLAIVDPFGPPLRPATARMVGVCIDELLRPLFELKLHFSRGRPHQCCGLDKIDPMFKGTVLEPRHPAYPSGHSTQAHLIALLLAELRPEKAAALDAAAKRIAQNREIAGLHYRSDSDAGETLAQRLFEALLDHPDFVRDHLAPARREWSAPGPVAGQTSSSRGTADNDRSSLDGVKRMAHGAQRCGCASHRTKAGFVCATDSRGARLSDKMSPLELVLDRSEGFIPLWAEGMALRWRFEPDSAADPANAADIRVSVKKLMAEALSAWGKAVPIRFVQQDDAYDFEISLRAGDRCNPDRSACVLASAFFPDSGRHQLVIYPAMFQQSEQEQIDTLTHELGHVFGLRHFFALESETVFPSVVFGKHRPFSIMNYGELSTLTPEDVNDLHRLYRAAWAGTLTNINGTPIRLVKPYHTLATQ